MQGDPPEEEELGGDAACWLARVCDACGALIEDEPHVCPRGEPDG